MKKTYTSPDVIYESFSLCSSIAAGCAVKLTTTTDGSCGMDFGSVIVFTEPVGSCDVKVQDGSPLLDGLCYHVPMDAMSLFNS